MANGITGSFFSNMKPARSRPPVGEPSLAGLTGQIQGITAPERSDIKRTTGDITSLGAEQRAAVGQAFGQFRQP